MANRERGELSWLVGGSRYTLRLTTNSCAELEDLTDGRSYDAVVAGVNAGSYRDVRFLLWAALRPLHPDVATSDPACLETIGRLIDAAGGRARVIERLSLLMALNAPPDQGGAEDPLVARHERIGGNSTLTH